MAPSASAQSSSLSSQLDLWSDRLRPVISSFAASNLFVARPLPEERAFLRDLVLTAVGGVEATYTGPELSSEEHALYLAVLHMGRDLPLPQHPVVEFVAVDLLRALGWNESAREYQRLHEGLLRLSAAVLSLRDPRRGAGYAGALIQSFEWQDVRGQNLSHWRVSFNPRLATLFVPELVSYLDWEVYRQIDGRERLLTWLHMFVSAHDGGIPILVSKVHELCGSKQKSLAGFRRSLERALAQLQMHGVLARYEITRRGLLTYSRIQPAGALPGMGRRAMSP
jgi:hypothetical protein